MQVNGRLEEASLQSQCESIVHQSSLVVVPESCMFLVVVEVDLHRVQGSFPSAEPLEQHRQIILGRGLPVPPRPLVVHQLRQRLDLLLRVQRVEHRQRHPVALGVCHRAVHGAPEQAVAHDLQQFLQSAQSGRQTKNTIAHLHLQKIPTSVTSPTLTTNAFGTMGMFAVIVIGFCT